jgi:arsenate reductase
MGGVTSRDHTTESKDAMAKTVSIYGIKACDTMKKARTWLEAAGVGYSFHDYKTQGIDAATLQGWAKKAGWEKLLNRSGTTFRGLPDADKAGIDEAKAIRLMVAQPSMIKRPVLDVDGALLVGFDPAAYAGTFAV